MSLADDVLPTAGRVRGATSSPVRDILALTDRRGVISFAGGLPGRECPRICVGMIELERHAFNNQEEVRLFR